MFGSANISHWSFILYDSAIPSLCPAQTGVSVVCEQQQKYRIIIYSLQRYIRCLIINVMSIQKDHHRLSYRIIRSMSVRFSVPLAPYQYLLHTFTSLQLGIHVTHSSRPERTHNKSCPFNVIKICWPRSRLENHTQYAVLCVPLAPTHVIPIQWFFGQYHWNCRRCELGRYAFILPRFVRKISDMHYVVDGQEKRVCASCSGHVFSSMIRWNCVLDEVITCVPLKYW